MPKTIDCEIRDDLIDSCISGDVVTVCGVMKTELQNDMKGYGAKGGNKNKALFTGPTHTQDFTQAIKQMVDFPVVKLKKETVIGEYQTALDGLRWGRSTMLVERKDEW